MVFCFSFSSAEESTINSSAQLRAKEHKRSTVSSPSEQQLCNVLLSRLKPTHFIDLPGCLFKRKCSVPCYCYWFYFHGRKAFDSKTFFFKLNIFSFLLLRKNCLFLWYLMKSADHILSSRETSFVSNLIQYCLWMARSMSRSFLFSEFI